MLIALTLAALISTQEADFLIVDGHVVGVRSAEGWAPSRSEFVPPVIQAASVEWSKPDALPATFRFSTMSAQGPLEGTYFSGKAWQPRLPIPSPDRDSAFRVARSFARSRGFGQAGLYLREALDVDLDGDGQNEQLISASSRPRLNPESLQSNDWSAILLRRPGPDGQTVALNFSTHDPLRPLSISRLRSIVDFDGDGNLEVVITSDSPTLKVITLWAIRQGKLLPVIEATFES